MKHRISNIDTCIKEKQLHVSIYIDDEVDPFIETSYKSLINTLLIELQGKPFFLLQLEVLKGCCLELCHLLEDVFISGPSIIRERLYSRFGDKWKITFDESIDKMLIANKSKILSWEQICNVKVETYKQNSYVRFTTTDNITYFASIDTIKTILGIDENEFYLLKGAFVSPILYKNDEASLYGRKGKIIRADNEVVKNINIRFAGTLENSYNLFKGITIRKPYVSDRPSYRNYDGYNGYDDNTIDNAFNGDPNATWNVD